MENTATWQRWVRTGTLVGAAIVLPMATSVEAKPLDGDPGTMAQIPGTRRVNSVDDFSDVPPGHWAREALNDLIGDYGCIAGYPDGTYRGNRTLTRYEFAAALDACVDAILSSTDEVIFPMARLDPIERLQEEFAAELATLRGRVDSLEERVQFLEDHQFSTTTKLDGEVIFALTDSFGPAIGDDEGDPTQTAFGHRTRLNFETSFSGEDLLVTRLQSSSIQAIGDFTGTPEGDIAFADDNGSDIELDALFYEFPVTDRLTAVLIANAGASDDITTTVNPFFDGDGAYGSITAFGTRHPIYYLIEQSGFGLNYALSDSIEIAAGYMATDAASPLEGEGLFNGPYGAIGQIVFRPNDDLELGLTYLHSYNTETGTGSNRSNLRSFSEGIFGEPMPIVNNAYGVELSWQLSDGFAVGGWAGYINTQTLSTLNGQVDRGSADIFNWAVTLAFPDLGSEGSVGGLLVGMEPKVTSVSNSLESAFGEDDDTSFHLEAFYQYQLNDNIFITPGVVWLTAPDHDSDNDDIVIGTIRTTFTF